MVAATINRPDLVQLFAGVGERAELTFIEYQDHWGTPLDRAIYEPSGAVTTWDQHRSADALLDATRPDRLVMLAINSRDQVALRVAARERGIEVLHLEHGYRLPLEIRGQLGLGKLAAARTIAGGVSRHAFFARSLLRRNLSLRPRLAGYAVATVRGLTYERVGRYADLRRPDRYVSFSAECFEYHREIDRVPPTIAKLTEYVGVPSFDCFVDQSSTVDHDTVALIDHQLHNSGIAGWSADFHRQWAAELHAAICQRAGKQLFVKEHPADRSRSWTPFVGRGVTLVDSIDELAAKLRSIPTVLGGATTLQMPAAALSHTALLTLEMHPQPGPDMSRRFVEAGVADAIHDIKELSHALGELDQIRERQRDRKRAFTERFLYRLDGRSGERLADAITR